MSHFLKDTQQIQSNPIFNVPFREIIIPQYKNLLRGTLTPQRSFHNKDTRSFKSFFKNKRIGEYQNIRSKNQKNTQIWKEQMTLVNFCNKLTEKELDQIRNQNDCQIRKQFMKLKRKMRKSVMNPHNSVARFLEGKGDEERLDTLLAKNHHEKIDIEKKHQIKITNRIYCLREAQQIDQLKTRYRNWLDSTNNQIIKSPNFCKMNYIIEKLSEKGEVKENFRKIRFTDQGKIIQKEDPKVISFVRNNQHSSYSPKSKIMNLRKKNFH